MWYGAVYSGVDRVLGSSKIGLCKAGGIVRPRLEARRDGRGMAKLCAVLAGLLEVGVGRTASEGVWACDAARVVWLRMKTSGSVHSDSRECQKEARR
jgi:hypothetical protein